MGRGDEIRWGATLFYRKLTGHADVGTAVSFSCRFDSGGFDLPIHAAPRRAYPFLRACVRAWARAYARARVTRKEKRAKGASLLYRDRDRSIV